MIIVEFGLNQLLEHRKRPERAATLNSEPANADILLGQGRDQRTSRNVG